MADNTDSEAIFSGYGIQQQLHKIVEDQNRPRQELNGNMEQMAKEITNHTEQTNHKRSQYTFSETTLAKSR